MLRGVSYENAHRSRTLHLPADQQRLHRGVPGPIPVLHGKRGGASVGGSAADGGGSLGGEAISTGKRSVSGGRSGGGVPGGAWEHTRPSKHLVGPHLAGRGRGS